MHIDPFYCTFYIILNIVLFTEMLFPPRSCLITAVVSDVFSLCLGNLLGEPWKICIMIQMVENIVFCCEFVEVGLFAKKGTPKRQT